MKGVKSFAQLRSLTADRLPTLADGYRNLKWLGRSDQSQCGEQPLLSRQLPDRGTYLEIGAYQPVMFSNTWRLWLRGWKGVSVEPNPNLRMQWRIFRPGHPLLATAVTPRESGNVSLHTVNRRYGAVSSLDFSHAEQWASSLDIEPTSIQVPSVPIAELIRAFVRVYGAPPTLLLLDCEGLDWGLIVAMVEESPPATWPQYVLLEDHAGSPLSESDRFFASYRFVDQAGPSKLFKRIQATS